MRQSVLIVSLVFSLFWAASAFAGDPKPPQKTSIVQDLLSAPAGAAQALSEPLFDLGVIRVSGGRLDEEDGLGALDAPRSVSVVGARELGENRADSLPERLARREGVAYSDDLGQGLGAIVDLRGFGGEGKQALVLFDGVRAVEPFDNSTTWHLYPQEFLERVDVTRGGASPVYGEGALSGVVALKTKGPTEKPHAAIETSYGSFRSFRNFAEASGTHSGVGVYAAGRYFTTDGYRQNGGQEAAEAMIKVEGRPLEFLKAGNTFTFADDTTGTAGPLLPAEAAAGRRQKDPDGQFGDGFRDRLLQDSIRLDYELEPVGLELSNLTGWRLRDQDSERSFGGFFPGTSLNAIGTESFSDVVQLSGRREGDGWSSRTTGGVEWSIDDIHNPFTFLDFTFGAFHSDRSIDRRMIGLFAENQTLWRERWTLETGVRWDKIDWNLYDLLSPDLEKHKKADAVSPRIGLNWKAFGPFSVFVSHSEAFKAPDSNTLIFETPNLFSPTPDIDPSRAFHDEIGARWAHPAFGSVRAAAFEVDTKKEILFNDITNRNENFDTVRRGVELGWQLEPAKGWELFGNVGWTRARFDHGDYDGRAIPLVPETRWNAGTTWAFAKPLALTVEATGVEHQFALNDFTNRFRMEDYAVVDAKLTWKLKNAEAWLSARNLFGEEYSSFAASDGVSVLNLNPSPEQVFEAGVRIEI